jgi:glycine oxidase
VIGAGVVGLCSALALADLGLDVVLIADARSGEASPSAAGLLDASHGFPHGAPRDAAVDARHRWPEFARSLTDRTGVPVPVRTDGILELPESPEHFELLHASSHDDAHWLDHAQLLALEPSLTHATGALLHAREGSINPLVLLKALKQAVGRHPHARVVPLTVTHVAAGTLGSAVTLTLSNETTLSAMRIVVAGGAWSALLPGLNTRLPLSPLKGQLVSVASKALHHPVILGPGYAVPRGDGRTILGATSEDVGFDATHSAEGVETVRALASRILPAFATSPMLSTWAGLRPMTPDGLPVIGSDAEFPGVVYACGHGRNGLLFAPQTGALVAALVAGTELPTGGTAFSPLRFSV